MVSTRAPKSRVDLLEEIAPDVERLYNRHMAAPRLWYPHEQINWGDGENFTDRAWAPADYPLSDGVRSSIYVNLLTEDNLPYYTETMLAHAPEGPPHPRVEPPVDDGGEPPRHGHARLGAHQPLHRPDAARRRASSPDEKGEVPQPGHMAELIAYVSFQERATQIAHRNTGAKLPKDDKIGRNVLGLIAGDETKHYLFYRDLTLAAFAIDPSAMMIAVSKQVSDFAMPGTGIPSFTRHAVRIAKEGIYGLRQYLRDVLDPGPRASGTSST